MLIEQHVGTQTTPISFDPTQSQRKLKKGLRVSALSICSTRILLPSKLTKQSFQRTSFYTILVAKCGCRDKRYNLIL